MCEDGTNVAAGTQFLELDARRVLPWYNPAEGKASPNWKDKWLTLRSRFERIIDECRPVECTIIQSRLPAYAADWSFDPRSHPGFLQAGGGLSREASRLCTTDWRPLTGHFAIRSAKGDPLCDSEGRPWAIRFGLSRYFILCPSSRYLDDLRPRPVPRLAELARDGTSLLYELPAQVALSVWRNWLAGFSRQVNSSEYLWLDALFELSWQRQPGDLLHSKRFAQVANVSIGLVGGGLFPRIPYDLASRPGGSIPHENGYPMAHHAKLSDVARASVIAIDEILERETITMKETRVSQVRTTPPMSPATSIKHQPMNATKRDKVFVSYSHKDKRLFEEFTTMLAPAIQKGVVALWDDTKIQPGQPWKTEIEKALAVAKVGVLLVSKNFLASEFIIKNELPPLLNAAKAEGATIFWVCLSPCLHDQTEIASYQAAHDVSKPLSKLSKPQREAVWEDICKRLLQIAGNPK